MAEFFDHGAHRKLAELEAKLKNGGGSTYDGGMEARVAKLEAAMEYVQRDIGEIKTDIREVKANARTDFLITWGAMIAGFLGLAGMMAKGFGWIGAG